MLLNIIHRTILGCAQFGFGYMSIIPNIMMSDCGSDDSKISASIGLTASGIFMIGGLSPLFTKSIMTSYQIGLIGILTQVCAFVYPLRKTR